MMAIPVATVDLLFQSFCLLLNYQKANTFNHYGISGHSSVVERLVANEKVVGSSPIARSKIARNIWK